MIKRQAVRGPSATVVADDMEARKSEPPHQAELISAKARNE
jgi:hypothetical protein